MLIFLDIFDFLKTYLMYHIFDFFTNILYKGCPPRGVMVKAMDCGNVSTRDRTQVALLRSLSGKYPWERYEPPYTPSYGLN